jgi:bifunctional ADP-heptose synthase (sugar kinase/adenylyltransferase)
MPQLTVKGNNTGGTANAGDVTMTQLATMLGNGIIKRQSLACAAALTTVVTHNVGTNVVMTECYRNSAPFDTVEVDVERTSINTVTFRFAVAPAASEYICVVFA